MDFTKKKGFTLVELMVVIAIIGILSSVVLASLNKARERARDAKRVTELKSLQIALALYYDKHRSYPSSGTSAEADGEAIPGTGAGVLEVLRTENLVAVIPTDPTSTRSYRYKTSTATNATSYCLGADLEGTANATAECSGANIAGVDYNFEVGY